MKTFETEFPKMKQMSELYNKGLLVMLTMRKHKVSKEKAIEAVEKFLINEDKRIPNVQKVINEVFTRRNKIMKVGVSKEVKQNDNRQ